MRCASSWSPARAGAGGAPATAVRQVPLAEVADVRVVEGPATIKGENGLLRNYVRLNVRDRDAAELRGRGQRRSWPERSGCPKASSSSGPASSSTRSAPGERSWSSCPIVIVLIFLILYLTYHDLADAALMLLTVPGPSPAGCFFQWLLGQKLSVTVWVGYIACFGMATSTGIIMLVYLREALARAGGLERISLAELRQAVLDGAVHRLRPKLLTEGTVVIGLAPMLWASGVGSEIIRPMAGAGAGRHPGGRRGGGPAAARALLRHPPPQMDANAWGDESGRASCAARGLPGPQWKNPAGIDHGQGPAVSIVAIKPAPFPRRREAKGTGAHSAAATAQSERNGPWASGNPFSRKWLRRSRNDAF